MCPQSIRLVTHGYEDIYGITMQDAKIFQSVISPKGDKNPNFRAKRRIELRSWDEPKDHRNPRTSRRHPGHYRAPQENARGRIIGPTLPDQWQLAGTESWLDNRRVVRLHSFRGRP